MKYLLTFLLSLCVIVSLQAQLVDQQRTADLIPGDYSISGQGLLEKLPNGELQFRLTSDFQTPFGPDVRILLSNEIGTNGAVELINLSDINKSFQWCTYSACSLFC